MNAKSFNPKIMMLGVIFAFVVIISIVIEKILPVVEMVLFFLTYAAQIGDSYMTDVETYVKKMSL